MSQPFLSSATFKFSQDSDDDDMAVTQELVIEVTTCGAGPYLVVSTERWAFDHPHELLSLLRDVKDRVFPLFDLINRSDAEPPESQPCP